MDFDYENDKKKPYCPVVDVDGVIANGKQFDLEIVVPEDGRDVIYGVVKDCNGEPIQDAVVKLIEVDYYCDERKPVSHTFTNTDGEFVFGPLCPDRHYSIDIWVNKIKHVKICHVTKHKGECLKGEKLKCEKYYDENIKNDFEYPCPLIEDYKN
jgi:hypothetical protein